jgi:tripartite-type tricarboxylate transporter receptor subunit TctC
MRTSLGQPVIVDSVAGASGSIGVGRVARAAPDGYLLSIGNWGTHVANGASQPLQYDLLADFAPVALLSNEPMMIAAKRAVPEDSLKGLVAWLRANPNQAFGTSGIGGPSHIAGVLFAKDTDTQLTMVPYRGAGPAMADLVAGHVAMTITGPAISLPQMRDGNIKILAVAARSRLVSYPDIPTTDDAGLPGFYLSVWHGLWAPKGTPPAVIAKLNTAVQQALSDPAVRKRYADLALELPPDELRTPEALGAFQKAEIEKWWPIIKAANIKGD